jgi:hypothetical protein
VTGGIMKALKRVLIASGALLALAIGGGAHWRW